MSEDKEEEKEEKTEVHIRANENWVNITTKTTDDKGNVTQSMELYNHKEDGNAEKR